MTVTEPADATPDTEPAVPVVATDAQADEGADAVELVRTGWVRLRWDQRTVRLRRPFFGELKTLRLRLEDTADAIADRSEEVQILGREILVQNKANDESADDELTKMRKRSELTKRSKVAGRELTAYAEDMRIAWWREVVAKIGVDGDLPGDEELPSWIADPNLPTRVLQHWRSVPLDRG